MGASWRYIYIFISIHFISILFYSFLFSKPKLSDFERNGANASEIERNIAN